MKSTAFVTLLPLTLLLGCATEAESDTPEDETSEDAVKAPVAPKNLRVISSREQVVSNSGGRALQATVLAGAHPRKEHLQFLKDKYQIKSVLSLQELLTEYAWPTYGQTDASCNAVKGLFAGKFCEELNADALKIDFENRKWVVLGPTAKPKDAAWLKSAVGFVGNPANQPVYVHCSLGYDRTGTVIAGHRVINEKWSAVAAFKEWRSFRPTVCDAKKGLNDSPRIVRETFEGLMNAEEKAAKSTAEKVRFHIDVDAECRKPAPPPDTRSTPVLPSEVNQ